jgi:hypothetical protein
VTALAELLTPAGREALGACLRDREELDRLVRERGQQRPPPEPPTLAAIATTERTTTP